MAAAALSSNFARPVAPAAASARATFFTGSVSMAPPRAHLSASRAQRARVAVNVVARATKGSTAGQQITVDVEKPLGLVRLMRSSLCAGDGGAGAPAWPAPSA